MKLFFVVFAAALTLSAADPQARKKQTPRTPQTPKVAQTAKVADKAAPKVVDASKPMAIPAGAVLGADGDYHYADSQGAKWIYRKTPFGVVRLEDSPERAAAQAPAVSGAGIKATEDGDKVRFERLGPFGLWKWEKKKSELDETEKAALQNSQANHSTVAKQD
jgi:hypothetical protein